MVKSYTTWHRKDSKQNEIYKERKAGAESTGCSCRKPAVLVPAPKSGTHNHLYFQLQGLHHLCQASICSCMQIAHTQAHSHIHKHKSNINVWENYFQVHEVFVKQSVTAPLDSATGQTRASATATPHTHHWRLISQVTPLQESTPPKHQLPTLPTLPFFSYLTCLSLVNTSIADAKPCPDNRAWAEKPGHCTKVLNFTLLIKVSVGIQTCNKVQSHLAG